MIEIDKLTMPGFAADGLDRSDTVRNDPAALAHEFASPLARRIALDGLDPLLDGDALVREVIPGDAVLANHVLLGKGADGGALFVELREGIPHGGQFAPRVWQAAEFLNAPDLAIYGGARSLVDWHARHRFCSQCGGPTQPVKGGWSRSCSSCSAEHFPRVDPVVIMLAEYEGKVLVGRQARFPAGRYSALAGFVEPGETLEGAVARELFEEAGVRATSVDYVMSQPWPFPSSLMIACIAQVDSDHLTIDRNELEDAFWVNREEVLAALDGQESAPFIAPPSLAVARHLLVRWLDRAG